MTYISPEEQFSYDNRRRTTRDRYQRGLAQTDWQQGQYEAQQGLDVNNLTRQWDQMRRRVPGQYHKRGMANSGLLGQGLQDYGVGRQGAFSDLTARYQQMIGQLGQQRQNLGVDYASGISDVDDLERMRRAQIAAQLQGL